VLFRSGVLTRSERGAELAFEIDIPETLTVPMSEDAALETFGALLDNAVRHARSRVQVRGRADAEGALLEIADDGPGIPEAWREKALTRGARLDESSPTHGLGLAIARDFIEASGGTLILAGEAGEGLEVIARWPGER
jgi:signal transduction histidine kinase